MTEPRHRTSRRWIAAAAVASLALVAASATVAIARVRATDASRPSLPRPRAHFDHAPVIPAELESPQAVTKRASPATRTRRRS